MAMDTIFLELEDLPSGNLLHSDGLAGPKLVRWFTDNGHFQSYVKLPEGNRIIAQMFKQTQCYFWHRPTFKMAIFGNENATDEKHKATG